MNQYPAWMKNGLRGCPSCESPVLMFYEENKCYKIKCSKCHFSIDFKASGLGEAKSIYNNMLI